MIASRRVVLIGFLVWLIPFAVSFALFPLRSSNRALFESIMPVIEAATTAYAALRFLRRSPSCAARDGLLVGIVWSLLSVLLDLPVMLSPSIAMTERQYAADIGVLYLMIPIITTAMGSMRAA